MATPCPERTREIQRIFVRLMTRAIGAGNDHAFACMIASRASGLGALPPWLGLAPEAFNALMGYHFPGVSPEVLSSLEGVAPNPAREDERAELVALLGGQRAGHTHSELWMAEVVAAGCLATDHLWQDLGLWNRRALSALMRRNFPRLAMANTGDMKWKRFLYKQLCEREGIYLCRAPSCEECADYHVCFGPED
ncbi:nitrogen fixation protein NifQ [Marichromatium sp. AB31]|uniref:nitrogen fixation protein NifQ n=1 Tax=Marichromatium sp. AB31 TaxID=2483362 RepID=UPI000F41B8F0|nr:nitrogen fixation protein NifQ [Marichromatium sp. AB31]RNE92067.1 nitrogen fixation protein NifQ [Marichromatium sp. AB31]